MSNCKRCGNNTNSKELLCLGCKQVLANSFVQRILFKSSLYTTPVIPSRVCKGCDDPIPHARLKAVPDAEYCVDCQVKHGEFRFKARSSVVTVGGPVEHIARTKADWLKMRAIANDIDAEPVDLSHRDVED
jgi:hypothetical protein